MITQIIAPDNSWFQVQIRRVPSYNIVIFIGLFLLACLYLMYTTLDRIIQFPYTLSEETVMLLLLVISMGLYLLKLFLWHLRGKEEVTVTADELIIRKKGTVFSVPRKYELRFIILFSSAGSSPYPWWMRIFGIAGGQVEFQYLGSPRYFGQTLDITQAQAIADLLNDRLASLHNQNPM